MNAVYTWPAFRPADSFRSGQTVARTLLTYKGFSVYGAVRRRRNSATACQGAAGFTLVELSVALVVIAVLAAVALHKLWSIQADAERTALENMVGGLRSALGINVASYFAKADLQGVQDLAGSNPMELLAETPPNYRGVLDGDTAVEGGEWYFDRRRAELVYRVRNADVFRGGSGPPAEARFAVKPVYEDRNRNGRFDAGDMFYGVRLEAITPYRWVRD